MIPDKKSEQQQINDRIGDKFSQKGPNVETVLLPLLIPYEDNS
jgi:hypothetical protein